MRKTQEQVSGTRREQVLEDWLRNEVAATYDAMRAAPKRAISADDAFDSVRARHWERTKHQS